MKRPMPPADMPDFVPAPEVWEWLTATIFNPNHKLYNPDHDHLAQHEMPEVCVMWAKVGFERQGKYVLGQAERLMIQAGGWKKARQEMQFLDWFGDIPDFLITLDASFCKDCGDVEFCALIEHELYHIAHATNKYGELAYSSETGLPKLTIRGHDVEEFVGVIRRYGASQDNVQALVDAAMSTPEVSRLDIAHACGSCILRIA